MRNPAQTSFAAVFQNEVLLNCKRVAPYALIIFFSSNAVLWSVAGAAVHQGWATNSDFYIRRNFGGFAFGILGLPLFAALIMAEPVIRDFRLGIDPLIFSSLSVAPSTCWEDSSAAFLCSSVARQLSR